MEWPIYIIPFKLSYPYATMNFKENVTYLVTMIFYGIMPFQQSITHCDVRIIPLMFGASQSHITLTAHRIYFVLIYPQHNPKL